MTDTKISALTAASTPLAGTEVLPIVHSSTTKKVAVSDLTAGRAVSALSLTTTSEVRQSGDATTYVYAYNPTAASGGASQSSPRVGFYGSEWNSGAGAVSMSGYWQLQALTNNTASPTSKLSLYLAGNGGTPAEVGYFGSNGSFVGYGSATYILAGGGNVTLENTTAATSATPQPSGKLILNSRSWNSANGNVGQTSYIRAITSTNNANPTVEAVVIAPSNGAGSQNEYFIFKGNGDQTLVAGNLVIGTSGKGIDFSANSHAAGMTSELLNDYEEGTWTPSIANSFNNYTHTVQVGRYTKVGNLVTVQFTIAWTTTSAGGFSFVIDGLPFTPVTLTNYASGGSIGKVDRLTTIKQVMCQVESATASIKFYELNTGAAATALASASWNVAGSANLVSGTVTYQV